MRLESRPLPGSGNHSVSSLWAVPESFDPGRGTALVLAPGAGADMTSPFLSYFQTGLAEAGILTVKFNFTYQEAGRKAPDPQARLEETYSRIVQALREDPLCPSRLFIGGKSMGGRIASRLAADGEPVTGLVLLGYPLHPPNRPERLRKAQLSALPCPSLFLQGSRDALCRLDLLREILKDVPASTLKVIEGADHSFKVLKRSGRTNEDAQAEALTIVLRWLDRTARQA